MMPAWENHFSETEAEIQARVEAILETHYKKRFISWTNVNAITLQYTQALN
jgi:hypothetical protein